MLKQIDELFSQEFSNEAPKCSMSETQAQSIKLQTSILKFLWTEFSSAMTSFTETAAIVKYQLD